MTSSQDVSSTQAEGRIVQRISASIGARADQVRAAIALIDGGATIPFIARYRKEATGGLDDVQLRDLDERLVYGRELEARRKEVATAIDGMDKLTPALRAAIDAAETKQQIEDIYLPYRPRRRTRAQMAREHGLEPLADAILRDTSADPARRAEAYVDADKGVPSAAEALEGAQAILIERFTEDATLVGRLRERLWREGRLVSKLRKGKEAEGKVFADYFDFAGDVARQPSHRVLALFRAEKLDIIKLTIEGPQVEPTARTAFEVMIAEHFKIADRGRPGDAFLLETVRAAWRTRLSLRVETDLRERLRESAEAEAVKVFAGNLKDLLMAAPAGGKVVMGLDPGLRTGIKVAIVDGTGRILATDTVMAFSHKGGEETAAETLGRLCRKHGVEIVAIGDGTASRETERLVAGMTRLNPELKISRTFVSEAGASVYSASAYASEELPQLDVTLRGAVSIARRLQDPLAELVKIAPQAIGVGQYQHDINEHRLARSLDAVVEDCVAAVGVDLNTASVKLLSKVSGLSEGTSRAIVTRRDQSGPFRNRASLKDVAGVGPRTFELAAGFLRVVGGDEPLDASAVHPEAYPLVRRILKSKGRPIASFMGDKSAIASINPNEFVSDAFGLATVTDVLKELEKPGRDPRPTFEVMTFAEGISKIGDLKPGMILDGVVKNVAAFGAFVDIGIKTNGLVHISAMSTKRVEDPRSVVRSGQNVKVKVLSVDAERDRIALTLRLDDEIEPNGAKPPPAGPRPTRPAPPSPRPNKAPNAFADAFAKARR